MDLPFQNRRAYDRVHMRNIFESLTSQPSQPLTNPQTVFHKHLRASMQLLVLGSSFRSRCRGYTGFRFHWILLARPSAKWNLPIRL